MNKRNGILTNCIIVCKDVVKFQGYKFIFMSLILIFLSIVTPFITTVLPSFAVYLLTNKFDLVNILVYIALYALIIMIFNLIIQKLSLVYKLKLIKYRLIKGRELDYKIMDTDYLNIDNPKNHVKISKASIAVYENYDIGFSALVFGAKDIIISGLSLILYAAITGSLNIFIIFLLILSPIINIIANNLKIKWIEKNKYIWDKYDTKLRYLKDESIMQKNGKDIRLYKIQNWFSDLFNNLLELRLYWSKKEYRNQLLVDITSRIVTLIQNIVVYGYLLYKVFNGMNIAAFMLYIGVISGIGNLISVTFDKYVYLSENNVYVNDYLDFYNIKDNTNRDKGIPIPHGVTHELEFKNMTFRYPETDKPIFDKINLSIKKGEKIAIVGENGAGKTTFVKLLCGLYQPDSGEILLDGINVNKFNIKNYYNEFSVVFQDVFAFAFSIAQNVACEIVDDIDNEKVYRCLELAGLKEKIDSLEKGINTHLLKELNDDGILLSGGELQKLMLARALYKDSKFVVLDEPTAALDPIAESEMYEKYNSLIRGKTSIFISHRLSSTRFCDRILFMKNGEIIESGTHNELMSLNGEYAKMFNIQAHYYQKEVKEDEEAF
ncbi:ABC transporter ATP-binding protein [Sedimentibacter sp. zth1]|uniref:ABC transporter ATP-binding protein n=1 Tax=Sedimentibacter sp. zth1 TaxID=2816908 RepID=UPI001A9125BD|nr:ABC transporter ATP-binding protein [Sedimentibacter sp. zth1]QSX07220.1 ABC transporter ATP-binding protein [Sedimentibacter sp. zth1]